MKETLGLITIILSIVGHTPYIIDILRNKTKPHVFTWLTWAIVTVLAFLGQWTKGGGAGSWGTAMTSIIVIIIAVLAFAKGSKDITKSDKVFFVGAILSIIPWYFTNDPTLSITLISIIDACAFIPTIRKTFRNPSSETFTTYSLNIFRHGLSIIALSNYNIATVLYPAYLLVMNLIMTVIMINFYLKQNVKKVLTSTGV